MLSAGTEGHRAPSVRVSGVLDEPAKTPLPASRPAGRETRGLSHATFARLRPILIDMTFAWHDDNLGGGTLKVDPGSTESGRPIELQVVVQEDGSIGAVWLTETGVLGEAIFGEA